MTTITITEIADAYDDLTAYGPSSHSHTYSEIQSAYDIAGSYYRLEAATLQQVFDLTISLTTNPEPYDTAEDQAYDVQNHQTFYVSTAHCSHPYWDTFTNVAYRIVHDLIGHNALKPHATPPAFDVKGEIQAWSNQLAHLQCSTLPLIAPEIIDVSFCETVGQLAYAAVTGDFHTDQPSGILPFDPTSTIIDDRN